MGATGIRMIKLTIIYNALVIGIAASLSVLVLSSVWVAGCVDETIRFGISSLCSWEIFISFVVSLSALLTMCVFLIRRASKIDLVLSICVIGILTLLSFEYVVGLTEYMGMLHMFTLTLGWMVSGRMRWKITWKPKKQISALFLIIALTTLLHELGTDYLPVTMSLSDGYTLFPVPLILRFTSEMCILLAAVYFGEGSLKFIMAMTTDSPRKAG